MIERHILFADWSSAGLDLQQIAADIPDYQAFLTIDELTASIHRLVEQFPHLTRLKTVGQTRRGDPIELLTIEGGPRQAFVFGAPHPNEPIGTLTIEYLTRRLCEDQALRDELGYTWHFITAIDADGMRLNEGWFKGPFTVTNYARHFFRPAPFDQVEWTFPLDYKTLHFDRPLPETQALMRVIDEVQPSFLYSLHNAGFGGVYYYLSRELPALYDLYHEIPGWYGLPLNLGEPETSNAVTFAPAIYRMLTTEENYEHLQANGIADPAAVIQSGGSSDGYARRYGTFTLVVELPYFDDPRVNDQTLTDAVRREIILEKLRLADEFDGWITDQLTAVQPELRLTTPIRTAVEAFLSMGQQWREADRQWALTSEETNRPATEAEVFSNLLESRFYKMLVLGMFARVMDGEIASGNSSAAIQAAADAARTRLDEHGTALERDLRYRALPIRSLVGVQVCAGLATAAALRDTPDVAASPTPAPLSQGA